MIGRIIALIILFTGMSMAEYRVFTREEKSSGNPLLGLLGGHQQRIEAHFFRDSETALCIVDEGSGQPRYGSLEAAMRSHRCIAGINGGYFGADAARTPIGLLCHEGFSISPPAYGSFTVAGIVYDTGKSIRMERSRSISVPVRNMREAIQGGPFLVEQGVPVPGLEKNRRAMRTFIATNGAGHWCIAITSPLSLHELAVWLSSAKALGDFRVASALNLDGGSSCSFWDGPAGINRPGFKAVRNYVGVRTRLSVAAPAPSQSKTKKK